MKVGALQLSSQEDWRENFKKISRYLKLAQSEGVRLVLLPENFAFFGPDEIKIKKAHSISQEVLAFLREMAIEHKLTLVGGGFPFPAEENKVYNRMVAFSPKGELLFSYDKAHLFDTVVDGISYRESERSKAGEKYPEVFLVEGVLFSGVICYDLRFPEIFRKNRVDVFLIPAAFTKKTGMAHWEILLRARAIENQCYVLAAAQWGTHYGFRETYGHSLIINPDGKILAELAEGEGLIQAELDLEYLKTLRESFPVLKHRKFF